MGETMCSLLRTRLDQSALIFCRDQFQSGGPLGRKLADLFWDNVWAYLPEGRYSHPPLKIQDGGVFTPEEAGQALDLTHAFISKFLEQEPANVFLVENQFFTLDSPVIRKAQGLKTLLFEKTLYHYVTYHDFLRETPVVEASGWASSYPEIMILTQTRNDLSNICEIDEVLANELIHNARHAIVGAFDQEASIFLDAKRDFA